MAQPAIIRRTHDWIPR